MYEIFPFAHHAPRAHVAVILGDRRDELKGAKVIHVIPGIAGGLSSGDALATPLLPAPASRAMPAV